MAIRRKYAVGDVFEIVLDSEGIKGYGRILDVNKPTIFVELYAMSGDFVLDVEKVDEYTPLLKIWCTDNGIKSGNWNIVGSKPVVDFFMPDFVTTDPMTGKLRIVRGDQRLEPTEELLMNAQPYGIFGHEAVRIRYLHELKRRWNQWN